MVTLLTFAALYQSAERGDRDRFARLSDQLSDGINERFRKTAWALRMASVAAAAPETMERQTWIDYLGAAGPRVSLTTKVWWGWDLCNAWPERISTRMKNRCGSGVYRTIRWSERDPLIRCMWSHLLSL